MPQKYDLKFSPRLLYLLTSVIIIHFSSSFHPCLHCFSICFLRISAVIAANQHSSHGFLTLLYSFNMCSKSISSSCTVLTFITRISHSLKFIIFVTRISQSFYFSSCFSLAASGNQKGYSSLFRSKQIINIKTQIKTMILIWIGFLFLMIFDLGCLKSVTIKEQH